MGFFDTQAQAWDSASWEFSLVFEGLEDADLWRRPDPKLLSVGEIVCHMMYWHTWYASKIEPSSPITTPLSRAESRYYLTSVDTPLALEMSAADVFKEFERVQKAVKEVYLRCDASRDDALSFEGPGRTFGEFADYMVFHIAYHTGQAFSARHLMGHKTNDN
jgi:hypothetical protein